MKYFNLIITIAVLFGVSTNNKKLDSLSKKIESTYVTATNEVIIVTREIESLDDLLGGL